MADLIERLRAATMGFDWSDLPDDALIPAVPLLREATTALSQEREAREKAELTLALYESERERWIVSADARIDAAEASLAEAKRLLKPFAETADHYDPPEDNEHGVAWAHDFPLKLLREIRTFLSQEQPR